ncbi:MAG: hypothetical protein ABJO86_06320 [Lentilitoribacter sp.]
MEQITRDEIMESLDRVLASDEFASSPNLKKFLSYIIEQKLDGNEAGLKAYSIAIDAFGRSEDFDSQIDPIVRVQAGRLRKDLQDYYEGSGAQDPIRIEVPRGSYKPEFHRQNVDLEKPITTSTEAIAVPKRAKNNDNRTARIVIAALIAALVIVLIAGVARHHYFSSGYNNPPRADMRRATPDTISVVIHGGLESENNIDSSDIQFAQEFRQALSRNPSLSIIFTEGHDTSIKSDFIIEQSFLGSQSNRIISLELVNGHTNELVWGNTYSRADNPDLVTQTIRDMSSQLLGASVRALEGRDPNRLSAQQLFMLATWVPGPANSTLVWERERIALARIAIKKDPNFGPAYSVLADKLAYLAAVDGPSNTKAALIEAAESARLAIELNPGDPNTIFNIAQYNWHAGNIYDSIRLQNRVLELAPNQGFAGFFTTVLPYTCLPPPVLVISKANTFDQSLSPDNPARWLTLSWIGWAHMLRGEYQQALEAHEKAAQISQNPYTTITRAAILSLQGKSDQAAQAILEQRANWPNLSPEHFLNVTYSRICRDVENPDKEILRNIYKNLAEDMVGLI